MDNKKDSSKKWLIKDREGRVRGPFFTDDILSRITRGEISGDEFISLYPNTDWYPISNDPQFYDKLLEALDEEGQRVDEEAIDEQVIYTPAPKKNFGKAERIYQSDKNNDEKPIDKSEEPKQKEETKKSAKKEKETAIIELERRDKILKKAKAKKTIFPTLTVILLIGAIFYYSVSEQVETSDRIRLLAPRVGQPKLSGDQIKMKTRKAVIDFVKDNFSNYVSAQKELLQIIEGDPTNLAAIELICLTYLELWPYAYQDAADLQSIFTATQMASKVDPTSIGSKACRTVDFFVRGRYVEANNLTDSVLELVGQGTSPPPTFYYFKARFLDTVKDYSSAISYIRSAEQLWDQSVHQPWLSAFSLEAKMLASSKDYNGAANRYRGILTANPNHLTARIELGVLEYKYLRNDQVGEQLLEVAMSQKEKAPREVMAKGFLGLAEIALKHQNKSKALSLAQKAYAHNSTDQRTKEIIVSLGGEKKLHEIKIIDAQLVYEGDQLVRENDCNAAQAHYKAAYEINNKNGLAAMKAAECLWLLSLSTEAMTWLNKAILADPNLIDAYILLANYYAQRYDFVAAGRILSKARIQLPSNYKVYRGFALVELRRNNMVGAINYAIKATQLYEADVESYIILANAYLKNNNFAKAFETASKAVEIDVNNTRAQIVYAEALAGVRGMPAGIDYLLRMSKTYNASEYRLALGQMYVKDQNYNSAQQIFERITRFNESTSKVAYIELARIYERQKRLEDAVNVLFRASQLDPSDAEPLLIAGQLYLNAQQPSEARQQFQRVLRMNKDYPLVNYYIGVAALQLESASEAIEQANIEKVKNPNLADPYFLAAEAYTQMKQYGNCASEYSLAAKLRPASASLFVKMARCYRMSSNLDAAMSMINQAGTLESGSAEVWKEQALIYEMRQEKIKAIEAYSQYLILAPNAPDAAQVRMQIETLSR
ncbi:MAG: hypothetical protein A2Z20_06360 [Bdellovibrionales bacterium RBG_16_40_8]|nr:MAG: hypothetical protein A2Z20_06360 [Bdellovibrionales bacterium RBG_16_40_8]